MLRVRDHTVRTTAISHLEHLSIHHQSLSWIRAGHQGLRPQFTMRLMQRPYQRRIMRKTELVLGTAGPLGVDFPEV